MLNSEVVRFSVNTPKHGKRYKSRVGSYGILRDEMGRYGVIKTSSGYFLLGGGIEEGETIKGCLEREAIEEAGLQVEVGKKIAIGEYHFYSTTKYIDITSIGHFYICSDWLLISKPSEKDHILKWLDYPTTIEKLYLDNQREAIRIYEDRERE